MECVSNIHLLIKKRYSKKMLKNGKLTVKKDGGDVDAITGATISTRAFSGAVQAAYETFKKSTDHGAAN
jgi:Na+-translocating ferredoxin:NAD+ oxidoreductase RnfG subunit